MATYVLPDNLLTDQQRDGYYFTREPEDAYAFMAYVQDQFPAVYDEAVLQTARPVKLADASKTTSHGKKASA